MPPDRGKILFGLAVFVLVVLFPIGLRLVRGAGDPAVPLDDHGRPKLVMPTTSKECVEDARYMRAKHMDLLNTWRDGYVREAEGGREWHSPGGHKHKMSLTGSCLRCHQKAEFCDRCHTFMGETPYCFTCHHVSPTAAR
jgi:hypothetical protein